MPRLVIDDREIEVPEGTKVIDAAGRLGIMIPRFCYHEALGAVGACRMCAVKFLQGPFKGVQMSCMVDAKDGMVVSTTDAEAVAFRKWVIEWLMKNHPHDCPVCDEGGHCLLQDETVSSDHSRRRFLGSKRTYRDQYLGPYVQHEMNRCIHCYRCSRFYREYAGYRDLGAMQIADKVYFGRFRDGRLESPFSGNLVDLCPTGVYTDKTSRFKVRRWDLERAPSVCIGCSLGCNTVAGAQFRAVLRIEARTNPDVNGHFICDAGRFGYSYTNGGAGFRQRPREPMAAGAGIGREGALERAFGALEEVARKYGPESVAALGSDRNSVETQCALKKMCAAKGYLPPVFFLDPAARRKTCEAVARLDERIAFSRSELESADFVIIAGADPLNEAAMSALALRQAFRKGGRIVVIDPRPVSMPFDFEHIPVVPEAIPRIFGMIVANSIPGEGGGLDANAGKFLRKLDRRSEDATLQSRIEDLAAGLAAAKRPAIVCGTGIVDETTPAFAADCALLLYRAGKRAGVFYVLPGANSYSSAVLSENDGRTFADILEAMEGGSVRALVVVENDLFRNFPDTRRLEEALARLELLIVIDYLPTGLENRASVFFPSSTAFETGSTFINQEGRAQFAHPVHAGGVPILGGSPEHVFRPDVPGGGQKPAWSILHGLETGLSGSGGISAEEIIASHPAFGAIAPLRYPVDGVRVIPVQSKEEFTSQSVSGGEPAPPRGLRLLLVDWMFGTGEISAYSDTLLESIPEPVLTMHSADAERAGLLDGQEVALRLEGGTVEVRLRVTEKMAEGVILLPRHQNLRWQKIRGFPALIDPERIAAL
ncbi:MAG: NADH-quinone oxidoreductase subunit NuoG [Desulfobacteraceae bacterium]|nr:NADH-quinone oxidoreductase subunit NuoG [Desulfobacteraceae bacterium]